MLVRRQPRAREVGKIINSLLTKIVKKWPEVRCTARDILQGKEAKPWRQSITDASRALTLKVLAKPSKLPAKATRASAPLSAEVIEQWGLHTEDRDSLIIARWLREGAPLGFIEEITSTGVFPRVSGPQWQDESLKSLSRTLDGWKNYSS